MSSHELCAICHENIDLNDGSIYTLPECNHCYHTNCIMTWFRTGKNTCPLCNNHGVNQNNTATSNNHIISSSLSAYTWDYKKKLLEHDYKIMRRFARKKEAPSELKKQVKILIKLEKKYKDTKKEERVFFNSIPTTLTVRQIKKKGIQIKRKKFRLQNKVLMMKRYIGLSNKNINIIIPIKQTV